MGLTVAWMNCEILEPCCAEAYHQPFLCLFSDQLPSLIAKSDPFFFFFLFVEFTPPCMRWENIERKLHFVGVDRHYGLLVLDGADDVN